MVDEDIKWTTEGEVVKEIEEVENQTERGLAFLDTLLVINEDGMIKARLQGRTLIQISTITSRVTTP